MFIYCTKEVQLIDAQKYFCTGPYLFKNHVLAQNTVKRFPNYKCSVWILSEKNNFLHVNTGTKEILHPHPAKAPQRSR